MMAVSSPISVQSYQRVSNLTGYTRQPIMSCHVCCPLLAKGHVTNGNPFLSRKSCKIKEIFTAKKIQMDSFYEYLCGAYAFCYSILAAVVFRLPMGICARFSLLSQCIYMYVTSAVGLRVMGFMDKLMSLTSCIDR